MDGGYPIFRHTHNIRHVSALVQRVWRSSAPVDELWETPQMPTIYSMKLPCWLLLCVKHGNICRNSSNTHPKFSLDPSNTFPTLDNLLWLLFILYQHHDHGCETVKRDLDVVPELVQEPLQPASPSRSTIPRATAQSGTAAAGAAGAVGAGSGARRRRSNGIHGPFFRADLPSGHLT